jgi:hypothetical protein
MDVSRLSQLPMRDHIMVRLEDPCLQDPLLHLEPDLLLKEHTQRQIQ